MAGTKMHRITCTDHLFHPTIEQQTKYHHAKTDYSHHHYATANMHPHIVDKELLTICFLLISYKFRLNLFWFTAYSCQREKFTDECFDGEKKALCSVFTPGRRSSTC